MNLQQLHTKIQPFSPFVLVAFAKQYGINISVDSVQQAKATLQQCAEEKATLEQCQHRLEKILGRDTVSQLLQLAKRI